MVTNKSEQHLFVPVWEFPNTQASKQTNRPIAKKREKKEGQKEGTSSTGSCMGCCNELADDAKASAGGLN